MSKSLITVNLSGLLNQDIVIKVPQKYAVDENSKIGQGTEGETLIDLDKIRVDGFDYFLDIEEGPGSRCNCTYGANDTDEFYIEIKQRQEEA